MIVLIVIHLMIVIAMIGVVLLQRSEGGGLGVGQTGGFLSSRGTANVLTRTTAILAAAFFLMSLGLSVVAGLGRKGNQSILQNSGPPPITAPAPSAPPPPGGAQGRAADQPQQSQPSGQAPAAPSGPQVPRSK
jgi:preprotein translocase subunit SecG